MADNKILKQILDSQSLLIDEIKDVKNEVKRNGKRIDKIGNQLAFLEDDAPTVEEFKDLEKRVDKLETQFASS